MSSHRYRYILIACASVILLGYIFHLFKMLAVQPSWGLQRSADFISLDDYLPMSAGKIDQIMAFTREGHRMSSSIWLKAADFLFPLLLAWATYRYVRGRAGKALLIALYLITIIWGLFVLRIEWIWLTHTYAYMKSTLPEVYDGLIIKQWIIQSVVPKAILIIVSLTALTVLSGRKIRR